VEVAGGLSAGVWRMLRRCRGPSSAARRRALVVVGQLPV